MSKKKPKIVRLPDGSIKGIFTMGDPTPKTSSKKRPEIKE